MNAGRLAFELLLDSAMILLALRLAGGKIRPGRVLAGAIFGTAMARVCAELARGQAAWLWMPTAFIMMAIGGGRAMLRRPLRSTMLLLSAAGLMGGTIQAMLGATDSLAAAYVVSLAAVPLMMGCTRRARRAGEDIRALGLRFSYRDKQMECDAIVDSGNTLRDYLTHRPVVVFSMEEGARRGLSGIGNRPLFADTAGGKQMMLCFTPQSLELKTGGRWKAVRAVIALSPGLPKGTPALVPQALIDDCNTE